MKPSGRKNIEVFGADVAKHSGYAYTHAGRISSRFANERLSLAVRQICDLGSRSVIDVGCGDGSYTFQLLAHGPSFVLGIDASLPAIEMAKAHQSKRQTNIDFTALNIYDLTQLGRQFDIAIVRGVLHHLHDPERAISLLLSVAKEVIVIEPNGYNLVLKGIERFSRYHVEHEEKSYAPFRLRKWFKKCGGEVAQSFYAGLVPFFCPDWFARILKKLEPVVEKIPLLRSLSCGVYIFKIMKSDSGTKTENTDAPNESSQAA